MHHIASVKYGNQWSQLDRQIIIISESPDKIVFDDWSMMKIYINQQEWKKSIIIYIYIYIYWLLWKRLQKYQTSWTNLNQASNNFGKVHSHWRDELSDAGILCSLLGGWHPECKQKLGRKQITASVGAPELRICPWARNTPTCRWPGASGRRLIRQVEDSRPSQSGRILVGLLPQP